MALLMTARRSSRQPSRFTCVALAFYRRRRISADTRKALRRAGQGGAGAGSWRLSQSTVVAGRGLSGALSGLLRSAHGSAIAMCIDLPALAANSYLGPRVTGAQHLSPTRAAPASVIPRRPRDPCTGRAPAAPHGGPLQPVALREHPVGAPVGRSPTHASGESGVPTRRSGYAWADLAGLARRTAALSVSAIGICVRLPAPAEKRALDHWFKLGRRRACKPAGSDPRRVYGPCLGSVAQPVVMRERLGTAREGAAPARAAITRSLADVRARPTARPRPQDHRSRRRPRHAPGPAGPRAGPPRSPKALSGLAFAYRHWKKK